MWNGGLEDFFVSRTEFVRPLDELTPGDLSAVGGKAYNCARLRQAGFPVPDGFAVTTDAMAVPFPSSELQEALGRFPKDTLFAVRSSAADEDSVDQSFAGIHETFLNVPPDGVTEAIRACWASVQSPPALAYRRTQGLSTKEVRAGVLVQAMVRPVVAGVAFTVNPVTGVHDELVISASWGLGEALVSGRVEPDEFIVRKSDRTVMSSRIGTKQHRVVSKDGVSRLVETGEQERASPTLSLEQLQELAALLGDIEREYGAPQDVEWAHDGTQFLIVQSRPVTTVSVSQGPDLEWTRANAREIFPDLSSPQALPEISRVLDRAARMFYTDLVAPAPELGPFARGFYGRLYFNLSQLLHINAGAGQPAAAVLRQMGHEGQIKQEDEVAPRRTPREILGTLPAILRILWGQLTLGRIMHRQFDLVERYVKRLTARDPKTMSEGEVWEVIRGATAALPEFTWKAFLFAVGLSFYRGLVQGIGDRVGVPGERLLETQLAAGGKTVSAQQGLDLMALANAARGEPVAVRYFKGASEAFDDYREALQDTDFLGKFEAFLQAYGHRGRFESDWAQPRYREDPTPLLFTIQAHVQGPGRSPGADLETQQENEAREAWGEFETKLNGWQRLTLRPRVRWALRRAKETNSLRERNRSEWMRGLAELRRWHLALAERFLERGWIERRDDYFFLRLGEIGGAVAHPGKALGLKAIVDRRKADYDAWQHLEMPLVMRESELPALMRRATSSMPDARVTHLQGLPISIGQAEGEVVVMREPSQFARMKRGAILVAPATDPAWTPLFTLASGVIVEIGGTLSHASIVAREYGLPALANVKDATKMLKDGDRVLLDATKGTVEVISAPTAALET